MRSRETKHCCEILVARRPRYSRVVVGPPMCARPSQLREFHNPFNSCSSTLGHAPSLLSPPPSQVHPGYLASNAPLRHVSTSRAGTYVAVAGSRGLAVYSRPTNRWRLFGNIDQVSATMRACQPARKEKVTAADVSSSANDKSDEDGCFS